MSGPLLSAPLLGGRVLELAPEGRAWRLSVTQIDGKYRRQVGGFDLPRMSSRCSSRPCRPSPPMRRAPARSKNT